MDPFYSDSTSDDEERGYQIDSTELLLSLEMLMSQKEKRKAAAEPLPKASLYVTGLDASVTEALLYHLFSKFGHVLSVKVCTDYISKIPLGYGYVNYNNILDAKKAMRKLDRKVINGKGIKVMLSNRDPIFRNVRARVFFKNFSPGLNNKDVDKVFSYFGTVMVSALAVDKDGVSKGHGFVQFGNVDAAENAIRCLNNATLNGWTLHVGPFVYKEERGIYKFQNCPTLYVDNMSEIISDEEVKSAFSEFGQVLHTDIMRDSEGDCLGHGFVVMENFQDAVSAIKGLHRKLASTIKGLIPEHNCYPWYVGWASSMFKRKQRVNSDCDEETDSVHKKLEGANLYVKNLDSSIMEEELEELFSEFGLVTSCKIMCDSEWQSRGFGFVAFATPEDATRAMNALNGKVIGQKPLHVAVAQRKEERREVLQGHFAHAQAKAPVVTNSNMEPQSWVGHQQMFFGRGSPGSSPPVSVVGCGFQHQSSHGSSPPVPAVACGFQHQLSLGSSPPVPAVARGFQHQLPPGSSPLDLAAGHMFQHQSSPVSSPPVPVVGRGFRHQLYPGSPPLVPAAGHWFQHQLSPGSSSPVPAAGHGFQHQSSPGSPPLVQLPGSQLICHPPYYVMPYHLQWQGHQMGGGTWDAFENVPNRVRNWSISVA